MNIRPYRNESSDPKYNAQRNLDGRTFYVSDNTLRFHKSRVLASGVAADGLIFWLIESTALDMHNTRRGFRFAREAPTTEARRRVQRPQGIQRKDACPMGELVTHDLLHALDAARGIAIAQNRPVRIYAVDVPSDAWGRDRKYWVDSRPPEGTPIALALESRPGESHDVRRVDP